MIFNSKFAWQLMSVAAASMLVACSDDDDNTTNHLPAGSVLRGEVAADVTLKAGTEYKLSGEYIVKAPATLTIEPGVTIVAVDDDDIDFILIEQGAKIMAEGTAQNPIVMTSELRQAGAWGGLHICGKAHTNVPGGEGLSEIGDAAYGGSADDDNSGVLRYIRMEYTGQALDEEHEANGVTFYGVGSGTTVEYVQAYCGSDDGFEFFGGSVCIRNCVATNCSDDSFDWTEGWNGKAQFLVAYQQNAATLGYECDCLMECDNNGKSFDAAPVSHPVIANVTLVGNQSADNKRGVRLRAGTQVELRNAIVVGKVNTITVETEQTDAALANGVSVIEGCIASAGIKPMTDGQYTAEMFAKSNSVATPELTNGYVGTVSDGAVQVAADSFFTATNYAGAVPADNDWTRGWTR